MKHTAQNHIKSSIREREHSGCYSDETERDTQRSAGNGRATDSLTEGAKEGEGERRERGDSWLHCNDPTATYNKTNIVQNPIQRLKQE